MRFLCEKPNPFDIVQILIRPMIHCTTFFGICVLLGKTRSGQWVGCWRWSIVRFNLIKHDWETPFSGSSVTLDSDSFLIILILLLSSLNILKHGLKQHFLFNLVIFSTLNMSRSRTTFSSLRLGHSSCAISDFCASNNTVVLTRTLYNPSHERWYHQSWCIVLRIILIANGTVMRSIDMDSCICLTSFSLKTNEEYNLSSKTTLFVSIVNTRG